MIAELLAELPFSATTAPYWAAAERGELVIQRCDECGRLQHPPRPICLSCLSDAVMFAPASGAGTIYSYTVVHRALIAELRTVVPYVLALIDLDEGVRLVSLIRGCPPESVAVGQRVQVDFERVEGPHGGVTLPVFRPASS